MKKCDKLALCFLTISLHDLQTSIPNNLRHANQHNEFIQHAWLNGINYL